jgi:DNA-binding MarR family transcriptional regulator
MTPEPSPGSLVLLTRLSRLVYRRATEDVLGMRLKQFVALNYLHHMPEGVGQRQLGDLLMLDANNCVLLLNDIEAAGWAERRRDPEDRRRHIVEITESGREALFRAEIALDGLEDEVLGALSSEERDTLRDLLGRVMADKPVFA